MSDSGPNEPGGASAPSPERVPVCYRHTDRETWVSCTRCERPICPDCMRPAAVGFQCPECVAEGKRDVRGARTVFGGRHSDNSTLVTRVLIGLNVGLWLFSVVLPLLTGERAVSQLGQLIASGGVTELIQHVAATSAHRYAGGVTGGGLADGEVWRLVTSGFFHYGILHLGLNMYGLWLLGQHCEELLGRWRFLALYLLAGVGGVAAEFLFRGAGYYPVGASGSIFGLMAALFFFFRAMNADVRALTTLLLLNLALGFFIANISVIGHLGGMVVGGAVGALLAYAPRGRHRTAVQVAGLVAIGVLVAGLVAVRIAQYGLVTA